MSRGYLAWLLAATISATGDGVLYFAIAWTASGLGAHVATLVLTAGLLPALLLTLVGGTAADRWGLRRTIIWCDVAMCGLLAAYFLVSQLGSETWFLLGALALASGVVNAFHRPANNAFPRLFFPAAMVPRAMSLTGSAMEVARIAGPPVGAVLVAALSMTGAVLADLASFAVVLLVLVAVRPPYEPARSASGGRPAVLSELAAGLRAVRRVPGVAVMLVAAGVVAGSVIPMLGLCVPLLARSRGWSAGDAGLIEAFWIVGALGVSLLVAKLGTSARLVRALVTGPLLAAAGIVVAVLAPASAPLVAVAGAWLMGIGTAVFTTHLFPLFLLRTPEGMLARFQSVLIVAQFLAMFAGNGWLGALAGRFGPGTAMLVAALTCAVAGVPPLLSRALRTTTDG